MVRLCFIIRRDVSSYSVSSLRSDSSFNISRRVESASALKIASFSLSNFIFSLYATKRLHVNLKQLNSCIKKQLNHVTITTILISYLVSMLKLDINSKLKTLDIPKIKHVNSKMNSRAMFTVV